MQSLLSVGGIAAGGLMASACAGPTDLQSVAKRVPIDFTDPVQSLRAFVKLMGDLDPTAAGAISGNRYQLCSAWIC